MISELQCDIDNTFLSHIKDYVSHVIFALLHMLPAPKLSHETDNKTDRYVALTMGWIKDEELGIAKSDLSNNYKLPFSRRFKQFERF